MFMWRPSVVYTCRLSTLYRFHLNNVNMWFNCSTPHAAGFSESSRWCRCHLDHAFFHKPPFSEEIYCVFTKDVFVRMLSFTSSRLGHVCPVCRPGPCLWGWNLLCGLLTKAQSDEFQDKKNSDTQQDVRTRKQTGCTGTGRETLSLLQPATRWQSRCVRLTRDLFFLIF